MDDRQVDSLHPYVVDCANALFDSDKSTRLKFLYDLRGTLENEHGIDITSAAAISSQLFKTYDHYIDAESKNSLLSVMDKLAKLDERILEYFVTSIYQDSMKDKMVALSDYLTLINWINHLSIIASSYDNIDRGLLHKVILGQAQLLHKSLESTGNGNHQHRHSKRIERSIITNVKYSIGRAFEDKVDKLEYLEIYVDEILSSKLPWYVILSYIGILSSALEAIEYKCPTPLHFLTTKLKKQILDYYKDHVLASRISPDKVAFILFEKFAELAINTEDFTFLVSSIEKCILRSPEIAFNIILPPILTGLKTSVDLTKIVINSKLLDGILSGMKSTKDATRKGSLNCLKILLESHFDFSDNVSTSIFINECVKNYKATSNADSKFAIGSIFSSIRLTSEEIAQKLIKDLMPLISKELSDIALKGIVCTFLSSYFFLLKSDSPSENETQIIKLLEKGLDEKRVLLKKAWFVLLANAVFEDASEISNSHFLDLLQQVGPSLVSVIEEAEKSPILLANNKAITCAYISIAILLFLENLSKNGGVSYDHLIMKSFAQKEERPSLLSLSVLTKLNTNEDISWVIECLVNVLELLGDDASTSIYCLAWIYLSISKNISFGLRIKSLSAFQACAKKNLLLAYRMVDSIYDILISADEGHDFELMKYDYRALGRILSIITQVDEDISLQNLSRLLIVSNHELVGYKDGWIGLCQRAQKDVGEFAMRNFDILFDSLMKTFRDNHYSSYLFKAAVVSTGELSFILPDQMGPKIADKLVQFLNTDTMLDISAEMLKIWAGNDGELVVDVLNVPKSKELNKNSRDYETRRWEEEIRSELAAKKKNLSLQRLTKEERLLVEEQLAKESEIRHDIDARINKIETALQVIKKLTEDAAQVSNGARFWYPIAVMNLLNLAQLDNSRTLVGNGVIDTFVQLSSMLSGRLGTLRSFVGIATLRVYEVPVQKEFCEEPLLNLLGRVLFRIKLLSDQAPLDFISFSYMLPLLNKILFTGKIAALNKAKRAKVTSEFVEEDPEEENLLLALEIVTSHSEVFEDPVIPKRSILEVLISLMSLPSRAKLAKECFLSMCQYISISASKQDLQVLFDNVLSPDVFVRTTILEGIDSEFDLSNEVQYCSELWIAVHDNDLNCAEFARTIWDDNNMALIEDAPRDILRFSGNPDSGIRLSIARAIEDCVTSSGSNGESEKFHEVLEQLIDFYNDKREPPPPPRDRFGLVIKSSVKQKDPWEERSTVAITFSLLASFFANKSVERFFKFLVLEKALGDKAEIVLQELQDAGIEIIRLHGSSNIEELISIFENCLDDNEDNSKEQNQIRESVVILYGALARHLKPRDDRVDIVVERMIKTLDTPSENVQTAISTNIAPLVPLFSDRLQAYFDLLFDKLFEGQTLASRRGAAHGIAGLVKGAGIKSLSEYNIIRILEESSEDKKNPIRREGVSFVFECLSLSLGKFFEPYVIEVLPIILRFFGDQAPEVREATNSAAKQIMKNTTSYGVKKLIPLALSSLNDNAWRSKKGSVELLGSMAYLDPTQLSESLSVIVPEIVGVLNDTHKEVRKAGDQALKRFGEVIRNPEIQSIVPDLIRAIGDPTQYTDDALDKLIKTQFVHYIDGPSLALIIHVIHRGMRDRSASTKKKACQIVGNMAILVDSKDLLPYLSSLVNELEVAMVDPVQSTRSTAARALGSLVEKLGEECFPDLIPRLLATLKDETKAGDRLGSAQALAEVICGLGINKLDELLPTILSNASSPKRYIRSGFMPLLLFLPVCFGSQFAPYLSSIIPPILSSLADSDEEIRDTALRAGRLIVKNYAKKAVDLLLPELENGLSDTSYRIRLSSVELTGDLLFQVTGISGKNELSEDMAERSSEVNKSLVSVLGSERRNRVLALLFICRSDVTGIVRNAAVDIWKALVANTPRTVKEVLPTLTQIIVRRLASSDEVHRAIAAQTLGETVRRVGANALSQLLPTLKESFIYGDNDARQGVCIALLELIKSSQDDDLQKYQDTFMQIVRDALTDPSSDVRLAAAAAFEALHERLGKIVIDEILPYLLDMLDSDTSEFALLALEGIMAAKSDTIFPILIPNLISPPVDAFKAKALSSLAAVAGTALLKRLSLIITTLLDAIVSSTAEPIETQNEIKNALDKVLLSVSDAGVNTLMQQLLSLLKHEDSSKRGAIFERLGNFFSNTSLDYSIYTEDVVSQLIMSLSDKNPEVVRGSFEALSALIKRQSKETLEKLVKPAYHSLSITGVRGEDIPGLQLPRGPSCILPIFSQGLMYGNSEQKEFSALGIADLIDKTSAANLKPFATSITGPLIRVIGEKVSSDIKAAILVALTHLISKIPQFLRPFIPQLQRTFIRCLSDPLNDSLRTKAVFALGKLVQHQPRVDSLVAELIAGARNSSDDGIQSAMLKGMLELVYKAGKAMSPASKNSILALVEESIVHVSEKSTITYARLLGSLATSLSTEEATEIIKSKILSKEGSKELSDSKFAILAVNAFLREAPHHVFSLGLLDNVVSFMIHCSNSSNVYLSDNSTVAIGKILLLFNESKSPFSEASDKKFTFDYDIVKQLISQLSKNVMQPVSNSPDTRRLSLVALRVVALSKYDDIIKPNYDIIVPSVFSCVRDPIIPIRLAAEKVYLAIFNLVNDEQMLDFNSWFGGKDKITTILGTDIVPRSVGDYTKRVASRLANSERERVEAGGDEETLYSDRIEDNAEVWAVGGVDLSD